MCELKKILIILFLLISEFGFTQTEMPFYEQIAFDFYRTEIIDSFPIKKRIKVYEYAIEFQPTMLWFIRPNCLADMVWKNNDQFQPIKEYTDNQWLNINSKQFQLDFSDLDKKQFKIKKLGRGSFPKLFISPPHKENENNQRIFVNVYLEHNERKLVIYHFEFDKSGKIKNWCQSISESKIAH